MSGSSLLGSGSILAPLLALVGAAGALAEPPARQVTVHPGDDLTAMVEQYSPKTEFHLASGLYRLIQVIPKDGDAFIGAPGAVMNGAELLTGFSREGDRWTAPAKALPRDPDRAAQCVPAHRACASPEDLFVDDHPLDRVGDAADVGPGKWYLDYPAQRVYLADDPHGHTVELSVLPFAIKGGATGVRIEGLTIEKYATEAGSGAVDARANSGFLGRNWVVRNNVLTLNHGMGLRLGDAMQVLGNKIVRNGQLGLGGGGTGSVVDGNEIAGNNYAGYDYTWEAGGSKFAFTHDLVVRNNNVHDNDGPGLWTDLENVNTLYENNRTASNREAGILHEVSYRAIIRNNQIENDGFSDLHQTAAWYGAGIIISGSADVEVTGNTVTHCMNGIVGIQPNREPSSHGTPYLLENLNVHDNVIVQSRGIAAGILCAGGLGDQVFSARNNRFVGNQFQLADPRAKFFEWMGAQLTYTNWKSEMHQ